MAHFKRVEKVCTECKIIYRVPANNAWRSERCPNCQSAVKRIDARSHRKKIGGDISYKTHTIIKCPDDTFRCGAMFSKTELDDMGLMGFLPTNMIVRCRNRYLRVVGDPFTKQILVNSNNDQT